MDESTTHALDRYLTPVEFDSRYFLMEQSHHEMLMTVIRQKNDAAVFEVFRNHSMETDDTQITVTGPQTITAHDRNTDTLLYMISGTRITLCGLLYGDLDILFDEVGIRIGDSTYDHHEFDIRRGGIEIFNDGIVNIGRPLSLRVLELLKAVETLPASTAMV